DEVRLGAAARAVLGGPEGAGARLERQSLRIAVAEAVDAGKRIGAAAKRIVVRNAAVAGDAVDLAVGATGLARQFRGAAVADGQVQACVVVERHASAEMPPGVAVVGSGGLEHRLLVDPGAAAQPSAHHPG